MKLKRKLNRNSPCPCGSGMKYKKCCSIKKPDQAEVFLKLGIAHSEQGKPKEAVACFQKALSVNPNYVNAYIHLGVVYDKNGLLEDAMSCFQNAVSLNCENPVAHYNLGIIFEKKKRYELAADHFKKTLSIDSQYPYAHFNLGVVYERMNRGEEAIDCYRKALSINPLLSSAHINLARAYQGKNLFDEALQALQIAVDNAPGDIPISDSLINLLNHYMPNIETGCLYVKAQKSLQQISTKYATTSMIADETVRQLYQQCHNILAPHLSDIHTNKSQLYRGGFFPNNCDRHKMVFDSFNIIPEHCFGCYKVTLEPRTVMELFKLLLVFDKLELPNNNTRKCIVEIRPEISGTYKGFIYCNSLDEGKEILNIVQPIVDGTISEGIPISVKRGCSEFQAAYPAYGLITDNKTQQMTYNEEWRKHEAYADRNMIIQPDNNHIDFTYNHSGFTLLDALVMRKWLAYAANKGDSTYLNIVEPTLPKSSPHS